MNKFSTYQSPFTWRYGSDAMRYIWSEENKNKLRRKIWVELASVQAEYGLVSKTELEDLKKHQDDIDIERISEIEKETHHDLFSAVKEFAEKAKIGGGKIHLGATSMDIVDNVDTLRIKQSVEIIESHLKKLLKKFSIQIEKYSDFPCMGYTHLQPAEPTTMGYRFALYAQDLLEDLELLKFVKTHLKAKGFKGAVGTQASYTSLLTNSQTEEMEKKLMKRLELESILITNQVGMRKVDIFVAQLLVSISQSLYKFAFDLRIMQSLGFGEWQEPFSKNQVGSSAMPFKRNPRKAEQICSLARYVESLSSNAWENASLSLLERTLDDSANRRSYIPEMFLALEDILTSTTKIVAGLVINEKQINNNLEKYSSFSATEGILMKTTKNGASRQEMHDVLRDISMQAWNDMQQNKPNPMSTLLKKNKAIGKYLSEKEIEKLLNVSSHTGTAPERARQLVKIIKQIIT
jgi:adenylosuccinate lyase